MDMYQKRKMRAEKKNINNQESFPKVSISCYIATYDKSPSIPYLIRNFG